MTVITPIPENDDFVRLPAWLVSPAESAFAITPADGVDLAQVTRGIYVGTSGDLSVTMRDGSAVTFVGIAAGVVHPIRAKTVEATGTTAADLIGVY